VKKTAARYIWSQPICLKAVGGGSSLLPTGPLGEGKEKNGGQAVGGSIYGIICFNQKYQRFRGGQGKEGGEKEGG